MPSDTVLIILTMISCVFGLIMVKVMNQQWFQRLDAKYKHEKALAKLRKRGVSVKTPPPSSPIDWIEKLKGINPDVLHSLVDTVSGDEGGSPDGDITDYLVDIATKNPELVQNFLQGLGKGKQENTGEETFYNK